MIVNMAMLDNDDFEFFDDHEDSNDSNYKKDHDDNSGI